MAGKIRNVWNSLLETWLSEPPGSLRGSLANISPETLAPVLLKLSRSRKGPLLLVCPLLAQAEEARARLEAWAALFAPGLQTLFLPEAASGRNRFLPEAEPARAKALHRALSAEDDIYICSAASLLAPAPDPGDVLGRTLELRKGMELPFVDFLEKLVAMDYDDEYEAGAPGEFSRRGGIVDVYSPAHEFPVRLEFFGDELESLRRYDPGTQRTVSEIENYTVIPRAGLLFESSGADFHSYVAKSNPLMLVFCPEQCREHIERFGISGQLERWDSLLGQPETLLLLDSAETASNPSAIPCGCYPSAAHLRRELPDELAGSYTDLLRQLTAQQIAQWRVSGYHVALLAGAAGTLPHLEGLCSELKIEREGVETGVGALPDGVMIPELKLACLVESELFSPASKGRRYQLERKTETEAASEPDRSAFSELDEGDYAVHLLHGIGIFKGIREIETKGALQELIVLEYADGMELQVPVWQAGLLSRYVGAQKTGAKLSKLGGKRWAASKLEASRSVRDLALEMLRIQALRASSSGLAFPKDDLAQKIFEESFPFDDTPDQTRVSTEIKRDMSAPKPMDRLLCGDVGYGKTEIAIRAAFKAVMAGKQVAVLVPTTILAQQHMYSFMERFAEYPVMIEMLSRFRDRSEQRQIITKLAEHKIDIIIGTHRLLQEDVRFDDLGLVVVDEEQRFGVEHKERLKKMRATVDVLTMTATPIPRTLYMAMTGVRDLSTIMTAPGQRLPVQTVVSQHDDEVVLSAIERELARGGQVFYLHNRVKTIEDCCQKLRKLVPGARFGIAHGRMDEEELEEVMAEFLDGKLDVLVCTTIIESGLDIPNANTIIIERADRFGLAELYQLRGRVGRWHHQAYACLLLPKNETLTGDARKRIAAMRRFTQLGAGFRLALRDLEIRGTGNLLGAEQSGQINSIGFDLYCQLLKSTVAQLQGKPEKILPEISVSIEFLHMGHKAPEGALATGLPPSYIPSEKLRLEAYRRLARLQSMPELDALSEEWRDRFGKLPEAAKNLLQLARIKLNCAEAGYQSLTVKDGKVFLEGPRGIYRKGGKVPVMPRLQPLPVLFSWLLDVSQGALRERLNSQ